VCIAKVVGVFDHRVTSLPRSAFEGLEPCDGNLSRTVLRGLGGSNAPRLPGLLDFNSRFAKFESKFSNALLKPVAA
jgi:hypothetical protein